MQKVNKGKLSQSITLMGALVMVGFITITQLFCSYPCLLLLDVFTDLVSGSLYIMSLTYPVLESFHQMTGIYETFLKPYFLGTED